MLCLYLLYTYLLLVFFFFFFFNDTATTEIYTLSLHDALPISWPECSRWRSPARDAAVMRARALAVLAETIGPVPALGRGSGRTVRGIHRPMNAVAAHVGVVGASEVV